MAEPVAPELRSYGAKCTHNKTGLTYYMINTATDCTNARDGTYVIIYHQENSDRLLVRECREFLTKFTLLEDIEF